jgi:uncharacterized membrane protein
MNRQKLLPIIGMIVCTFFSSFGSYFLKRASVTLNADILSWLNINIFISLSFYFVGFILLFLSIKNGQVSKLHGIMSLSYIWVIMIGYFLLAEQIGLKKFVSIFLIIIGVIFVTWQD